MNCSEKQLWKFGFASLLLAPFVYSLAGVEEWREFPFVLFFLVSGLLCISIYYQGHLWRHVPSLFLVSVAVNLSIINRRQYVFPFAGL